MNNKETHSEAAPAQIVESILNEFSFYNDHVLRGPLCRIAGLVSIIHIEKEEENKKKIIQNVVRQLKPGGWLLVGHSESIHGYHEDLKQHRPSCYQYLPASRS